MTAFSSRIRCGSSGLLAVLAGLWCGLAGCATVKQFRPSGNGEAGADVFVGHRLEPELSNTIYGDEDDNYRIEICQRQPAPADSTAVDALSFVRIEDFCLKLCGASESVCPELEKRGEAWVEPGDGYLHGPLHSWGWIHIPDGCGEVEISYTAVLVGGADSRELGRKSVRQTLYRRQHKVPSFYK